ncbi:anti-sigma factor [Arthrobacter mobilis]|uniref:Regulator of SigK n=1 Tax=Arthrobacter mobilis TaxID=2724944 RepID=A0A7X6HEZ9_9MICC|nr:anti-sigma factor [Arthrobacter mobilis]NKX54756.1 anti-sigma factor [Arthrobacter mobilis]
MDEQLHLLTGAYALNAVDDVERAAFERHALESESTLEEVRSLSETAALLAYGTEAVQPPARVKDNVMAAIRNTRQLPAPAVVRDLPATGTSARSRARRRALPAGAVRALAAAAAVLLLAVAGLGGWVLGQAAQQRQLQQQLAAASREQAAMMQIISAKDARLATQRMDGAVVTVAYSGSADQAAVMAHGLPQLPEDKGYELWIISGDDAVPAGMLTAPAADAPRMKVLEGGLAGATHVGITIEPAAGSAKPTSPPIMLQEL